MPNFEAKIETEVADEEVLDILAGDTDWKQAQWPACRDQAENAGKTVTGNPAYVRYEFKHDLVYDFVFNVPVA